MKNTPLWADSVFGIDVSVRELQINQETSPTFGRLPDIVEEVYSALGGDDKNVNKQMTKSMLIYYTTAILWTRLLDIKAKRGNANLPFEEIEFCKAMETQEYNIPQPLYLFLKGIGEVKDLTGKTVSLADHALPRVVQQGLGGYHSAVIDAASHNLYEEICGDILMAETSDEAHPVPNFRVLPANRRATCSLNGYFGAIGARKEEVKILLESVGIRSTTFEEQIAGTRLNVRLLQAVSDYFAGSPTFRNEKVKLEALTVDGDSAQFIRTKPTDENVNANASWTVSRQTNLSKREPHHDFRSYLYYGIAAHERAYWTKQR
ncbi:unnamed protein product [Arctia plantaginis]|uniref:Uncharacterized protein n=1 Tax=Arctia plantaginis TaxID=874455 RepID=A0A8S1APC2_ARCPL|nr:unnamed protein product [Arctia plantaginis]